MKDRVLAIIPARSGSKGLPHKNIKKLDGKPLIAYTIEAAKRSNLFKDIFVSTDSEEYAEISKSFGAIVPFLRDEDLASDNSKMSDVIINVLEKLKMIGKEYDYFMLLQPTSPLRTEEDILNSYNFLKMKNGNSVIAVCEAEHSPLWMNTLSENLCLDDFLESANKNRQELEQYYRINGAIYLSNVEYYKKFKNFYKEKSYAYVMDREKSIDIDTKLDFILAEVILKYINKVV